MIPQNLVHPRALGTLGEYLTTELRRVRSERWQLEQDWVRWQEIYRARSPQGQVTFPFPGASKIVVPVAATDVEMFIAQLMGMLYASPNLWTFVANRPDFMPMVAKAQEYVEKIQEADLNMYAVSTEFVTELTKLGTSVTKTRYSREYRKAYEWRERGGQPFQQQAMRLMRDTPEVKRVALADFYVPASASSVQEAPWCAERLTLTMPQFESRVQAGIYTGTERVLRWWQSQLLSQNGFYEQQMQRIDRFQQTVPDKLELHEFWLDFDIDGDGVREAIVCTMHEPSQTFVRIDFNPFFSQEKPYDAARFIVVEGRFYGIGLCEMYDAIQDEITAMHRQRLDAGTIQNTPVYKAKRGSVKTDLEIFPGVKIAVDDHNDLTAMPMGVGANITIQTESFLLQYAKQRSGVSDYMAGGAGSSNMAYSGATTTIEMLRQGKLKIDQTLREIRKAFDGMGRKVFELLAQFDQGSKFRAILGDADGMLLEQLMSLPIDVIRAATGISITATDAHLNKETQIRTNQLIYQMVMEFYMQLFQALQIATNPQVPPPLQIAAQQMIEGGTLLMRRILDTYNVQDAERIIPNLQQVLNVNQTNLAALQNPLGGGAPMGGFAGPASGMAAGPGGPAGFLGAGAQGPALAA